MFSLFLAIKRCISENWHSWQFHVNVKLPSNKNTIFLISDSIPNISDSWSCVSLKTVIILVILVCTLNCTVICLHQDTRARLGVTFYNNFICIQTIRALVYLNCVVHSVIKCWVHWCIIMLIEGHDSINIAKLSTIPCLARLS